MGMLSKRRSPEAAASEINANELLRQHFEARFQPLGEGPALEPAETGSTEDDLEWGGLSDEEEAGFDDGDHDDSDDHDTPQIEVVDHSNRQLPKESMTKRELKAFMSSRPPSQTSKTSKATISQPIKSVRALPEDAPSLLKQDLELRRLLAESHLLNPHAATKSLSSVSVNAAQPKSFAAGRTRQKATDLRVQALGSKVSIHKQDNMPMHMRKGMVAAAEAREAKRRREARENGIILERETRRTKRKERGRDGGRLDRPGVGRLKGAELRISERDVRGIEETRDTFGRRCRRR